MERKDYFSSQSKAYATFRPSYPDELYEFIFRHLKNRTTAWDCATGNGQVYDMVINGTEVGGGSIRIHDRNTQQMMFTKLGFSDEEARKQFGFLMEAFEFGAPPHGGIAFGFDRLCSIFGGADSIRDFIAFPKNNAGRDVMIDSPSTISRQQLDELGLTVKD